MLFNKAKKPTDTPKAETVKDEPVLAEESAEEGNYQSVLTLNTEVANNSFILHLSAAIKELKYELLKYDPCIKDMRIYVDALKNDIVALTQLKEAFVKK